MMEEITGDELCNAAAYCTGINARASNSYKLLHVTTSYAKSSHVFFLEVYLDDYDKPPPKKLQREQRTIIKGPVCENYLDTRQTTE